MNGAQFKWLLSLGAPRIGLARQGLMTLAVALVIVAGVLLGQPPSVTQVIATRPAQLPLQAEPAVDCALVLARVWFLAPQLLPHDR